MNHIEGTLFIALFLSKFVGLPILEEITEIEHLSETFHLPLALLHNCAFQCTFCPGYLSLFNTGEVTPPPCSKK